MRMAGQSRVMRAFAIWLLRARARLGRWRHFRLRAATREVGDAPPHVNHMAGRAGSDAWRASGSTGKSTPTRTAMAPPMVWRCGHTRREESMYQGSEHVSGAPWVIFLMLIICA